MSKISDFKIPLICLFIFSAAFVVRWFSWQDNRLEAVKVQTYVTSGYEDSARQLARGSFKLFLSDINHLGHPPGYPIFLAAIFKLFGKSDSTIQLVQITLDSITPALLFLIALELTSWGVAIISAMLAALSPQFAYFPVLLCRGTAPGGASADGPSAVPVIG